MVRFIIPPEADDIVAACAFTFQYGYIYYACLLINPTVALYIYIPIWLYLLSKAKKEQVKINRGFTFQYG